MSTDHKPQADDPSEDRPGKIMISFEAPVELIEEIDELRDGPRSEEIREGLRLRRTLLSEASENNQEAGR